MKISHVEPPRVFAVGRNKDIHIGHCADILLESDEQVTFITESGTEFDVVRKSWGYYATPSLNSRLSDLGLKAVLVRGQDTGRMYLLLVEKGREEDFYSYVEMDRLAIICWLDDDGKVSRVADALGAAMIESK
jgi:hypothetical protein